jgi:MoaA/NifB/PqqE/SkfB family radical SAM enzyme
MLLNNIQWLHVEASTKCNAWCPACPRNKNGYGVVEGLVEEDLSTDKFLNTLQQLPNLHGVQFCGNYGDPIIANNILDLVSIAKKYAEKIQIHTNGSLRNVSWWQELANLLHDINHDVWFGIDGMAGVHEIYRQGTDYDKIIANAQAFIKQGGYATWQYIPYAHNEHQIKDCLRTSQKLGFKKFTLVKNFRNITKIKHFKTGAESKLDPPQELRQIINFVNRNSVVDVKDCMHLSQPGIYLGANGKLSYCCYHHRLNLIKNQFDTLEELQYNTIDISNKICINSCGINNGQ